MEKKLGFIKGKGGAGASFSLMIILFTLLSFIGGAVLSLLNVKGGYYRVISSLFSVVALISTSVIASKIGDGKFVNLVGIKKFNWVYTVLAILLCVGMMFAFGYVNESLGKLFNLKEISLNMDTFWKYLAYVFFLAILPTIAEEFFFRGTFINLFGKEKLIITAVISAGFFALYHCSVAQLVYQFLFGVGMGVLAVKSGSVFPSMIAHFLNNFIIITLNYLNITIDLFSPLVIVIGINLLVLFCVVIYFYQKTNKTKVVKSEKGSYLEFLLFSSFGLIICLVLVIASLVVV